MYFFIQFFLFGLVDFNFILMVFLILVLYEDFVKLILGFYVVINYFEGKLIIYMVFYLKIQVEMEKVKFIKFCKNLGMIVYICFIKNLIWMQIEFIYDI